MGGDGVAAGAGTDGRSMILHKYKFTAVEVEDLK